MPARIPRAFATVFLLAGSATATTHILVPDSRLVDTADVVVRAEVAALQVDRAAGALMTSYHVDVLDVFKGDPGGSRLVVRLPGGVLPDRSLALMAWGVPRFTVGQRVLLFLRASEGGTYRPLHVAQGVFLEADHLLRRVWLRAIKAESALNWTVTREGDSVRDGEAFERWIADRAAATLRPADYLLPIGADEIQSPPQFILLDVFDFDGDGKEDLTRWFEFDDGETVVFRRHKAGLPGLTKAQTKQQVKNAVKAWNNQSGAPIELKSGAKTGSMQSFNEPDGINSIVFEDVHGFMGGFDCFSGGTLGIGVTWVVLTPKRTWKDDEFLAALEAEVNINDAAECYWQDRPDRAAEVFTHELGHALGFAHPCGDPGRPGCKDVVAEATMAPISHDDGRAASLFYDDVLAARYLYDPDYDAAWCKKKRPGSKKFCKKCGPCGEGQGHCANEGQCLGGLTCVEDAGEPLGFPEGTNLCLPG